MKTWEEFEEYFNRNKSMMAAYQNKFKKSRFNFPLYYTLAFLVYIGMILFLATTKNQEMKNIVGGVQFFFFLFCILIIPITLYFIFLRKSNKAVREIKNDIIIPALRFLAPELTYDNNKVIDKKLLKTSPVAPFYLRKEMEIFGIEPDINGEDHFSGLIGNTSVEFSEIWLQGKKPSNDISHNRNIEPDPTRGLFLNARLNKALKGSITIYPRGKLIKSGLGGNMHPMNIENKDFNTFFILGKYPEFSKARTENEP